MKLKSKKHQPKNFIETAEATEFRRLEHRLFNNASWKKQNVFMVTSANLGEGKSTISSLLSITHAHDRELKTLLIDCDLRRPRIHQMFSLPNERGLANFFEGRVDVKDIIQNSRLTNLKIITAGHSDISASDLMNSERLGQLVRSLSAHFDMIILDSPPVVPVSDPLTIADVADGIYWVIKAGYTKKKLIKHAIEILGDKREKIVGTIVNNAKNVMPYYYDYNYYGNKYTQSRKDRKVIEKTRTV